MTAQHAVRRISKRHEAFTAVQRTRRRQSPQSRTLEILRSVNWKVWRCERTWVGICTLNYSNPPSSSKALPHHLVTSLSFRDRHTHNIHIIHIPYTLTGEDIMVLPRGSNYSSAFRTQTCRTARTRAAGQSWRQVGPRSYASGHHEGSKKASSDLPWYALL